MKYEIVIYGPDDRIALGKHIGTAYERKYDFESKSSRVKLHNFGMLVGSKETYFNGNIHLQKKLVNYFESQNYTIKLEEEMESIGIYPFEKVNELITLYNQKDGEKELIKKRIENLTKKN